MESHRTDLRNAVLSYPGHVFNPEDLLSFVELEGFRDDWRDCDLTDQDLFALQLAIMITPKGPPVVPKTGGFRKIRFSPKGSKVGKSGAFRVLYVYFQEFGTVLLVAAYSKGEIATLSAAGKEAARQIIQEHHRLLSEGSTR